MNTFNFTGTLIENGDESSIAFDFPMDASVNSMINALEMTKNILEDKIIKHIESMNCKNLDETLKIAKEVKVKDLITNS